MKQNEAAELALPGSLWFGQQQVNAYALSCVWNPESHGRRLANVKARSELHASLARGPAHAVEAVGRCLNIECEFGPYPLVTNALPWCSPFGAHSSTRNRNSFFVEYGTTDERCWRHTANVLRAHCRECCGIVEIKHFAASTRGVFFRRGKSFKEFRIPNIQKDRKSVV